MKSVLYSRGSLVSYCDTVKDPVDKPEAMLTPGIVQLYSPFVYSTLYSSKDNLYMNP